MHLGSRTARERLGKDSKASRLCLLEGHRDVPARVKIERHVDERVSQSLSPSAPPAARTGSIAT